MYQERRVLFEDNQNPQNLNNIPPGISYVSISSKKGEVGYGTKLFMRNGTFEKFIEGRIKDGETLDGYGTMFYNLERTTYYQGNWRDGLKHGTGTLVGITCEQSYTYIGDWQNDKMNGFGKIIYTGIGYYEGDIKNNKYEGSGKFVYDTGKVFIGRYSNNERVYGTMTKSNGETYVGSWRDNQEWIGKLTVPAKGNCGQTQIQYENGKTRDGTDWVALKDNPRYRNLDYYC